MSDRFTKIGHNGEKLPAEANAWEAVLDSRTGLMWAAEHIAIKRQEEAAAVVDDLRAGGFQDWRVPTIDELFGLADRTRHNPAIDTDFFPDTVSDWYWTSTPAARAPSDCAWLVDFGSGNAYWSSRGTRAFVRAVRDVLPEGE